MNKTEDRERLETKLANLKRRFNRLEKEWEENVRFGGPAFAEPKELNKVQKEIWAIEDQLRTKVRYFTGDPSNCHGYPEACPCENITGKCDVD